MELRQLKTLVNILDFGGFAAAGESSGLTQSAVSLQIKALEEEFGEDLFDRSKRPPVPTAKAITLARKSREILRMCNELTDLSEQQLSGSLQLGSVPSVQRTLLPKALKKLRDIHPDLFISIETGLSDELLRSVHRGILDAAIISEPTKLPRGMSWHPFATESLVVIAQNKSKGVDAVDVLQSNPFIRFKHTATVGVLIDTVLKDLGIKVKTVVETDNFDSIWEMIACGMGVAIVPQNVFSTGTDIKTVVNDGNPHDKKKPRNIRMIKLGGNTIEVISGLVMRTADSKANLAAALYEALQSR